MDPHSLLIAAINNKQVIHFIYDGLDRIVEPHDYGILKGESERKLLAYQLSGATSSGPLPDWRVFFVSRIKGLEVLGTHFPGNRPARRHYQWDILYARVSAPEQPSKEVKSKKRSA